MPVTVAWDDWGATAPTQFTIPDDVLVSADLYRNTVVVNGTPKYASVREMLRGVLAEQILIPAVVMFPTPSLAVSAAAVAGAAAAVGEATASYQSAVLGIVPGLIEG